MSRIADAMFVSAGSFETSKMRKTRRSELVESDKDRSAEVRAAKDIMRQCRCTWGEAIRRARKGN